VGFDVPDDYAIIPGSGRLFERQVKPAAIAANSHPGAAVQGETC
jgi:hypothetical protein